MSTNIVLYQSKNEGNRGKVAEEKQMMNNSTDSQFNLPTLLFITSYPPRQCGIATYSQDLIYALNNQFKNSFTCSICALESETEQYNYEQQPKYILNTDSRNAFLKIAFYINKDKNIKLVVMQHEFGFFAKNEIEFKQFFNSISKPIAFVFHTVLPKPNSELKAKVENMAAIASAIIVMTNDAATLLKRDYCIQDNKISIIPHGTHLVPPLNRENVKANYQLSDRIVLSTFGLLNSSKNIESTLESLPEVIKKYPNVLFLAIGKTHPSILKQEGEKYRNLLENKVIELGLENHVRFVNEYLPLHILLEYLQLSDIYLFTSKDPNQAVSGTFSYALSCGCPIISTPIPHAKEVLKDTNGLIIDFESPKQLSKAIISLLSDEKLRAAISTSSFQKMASTAWQNSAIAHALLFKNLVAKDFTIHYGMPIINLNHIRKMTTQIGIIQFSKIANPDTDSGYTLDDNASALIAICQHYELFNDSKDLKLITTYLEFIRNSFQDNGKFLNYLSDKNEWTKQNENENLEDSNGRAIWGLGYVCSLKQKIVIDLSNEAEQLINSAIPHLEKINSPRAMAFIIKGLCFQNNSDNHYLIEVFANRLVQMYKHVKTNEWLWFEDYLTYGNSLLPEAMLCAYQNTENSLYKQIAVESFDFLLSKIFINGKIKVISNKGWFQKDTTKPTQIGGEQPIDVAYTIIALENFYNTLGKKEYKQKVNSAFNWFLGENHLHQIVYNPCTGGCYDGVEEYNVNLNQGAESTISYLMSRLAMERMQIKSENHSFTNKNKLLLV